MVMTTSDVAERLGIDASRVRRLAIKHNIGSKVNERARVFTEGDVAMLQSVRQPAGRPSFVKTFDLSRIITHNAWIFEIDAEATECVLRDWDGIKLADAFIGFRDGKPVVFVDDDAHTVMTPDDLPSQHYHVDVVMPRLPRYQESPERYTRQLRELAVRAGALAAAGVHMDYDR